MSERKAEINRKTGETEISLSLNLDGTGIYDIDIPIGFLKHMLELFSKHSFIDLKIKAKGDIEVDYHHLVEDIGIVLGQAIKEALGNKKSIFRYGFFLLPMDESLAEIALDISNRPVFVSDINFSDKKTGDFDTELILEFLHKLVLNAGLTLHIILKRTSNVHHGIEAIFKGLAKSLNQAITLNDKIDTVMSTKGII